jgi:hypothetical protein
MDAPEMMRRQLDDAGFQLSKALEGMNEQQLDHKIAPGAMSPREQLAHLGEAYQALITHCAGGKHKWGSFDAGDRAIEALSKRIWDLRKQAVDAALAHADDEHLKLAHEYVLAHDYYHVGQICASRLDTDPSWNVYSIYNFATT